MHDVLWYGMHVAAHKIERKMSKNAVQPLTDVVEMRNHLDVFWCCDKISIKIAKKGTTCNRLYERLSVQMMCRWKKNCLSTIRAISDRLPKQINTSSKARLWTRSIYFSNENPANRPFRCSAVDPTTSFLVAFFLLLPLFLCWMFCCALTRNAEQETHFELKSAHRRKQLIRSIQCPRLFFIPLIWTVCIPKMVSIWLWAFPSRIRW